MGTTLTFLTEKQPVFDISVADNHNFFANNILVHNCGEQVLAPGGICCLSSINLTQFINADGTRFDFEKFQKYIPYVVRFLDNVDEISSAPLDEYIEAMRKKRRIGIGILGWGSLLFMLKIRFGSEQAGKLREQIMQMLSRTAYMASIDLAEEKGMFEYCQPEKHVMSPFIQQLGLSDAYLAKLKKYGIRNSALLSIQPTGNTSILANITSGGLEPVYMPEYIRTSICSITPDSIIDVTPKWHEGEFHETEMFHFAKEGDEQILRGIADDGTVYKIDSNRGLTKETLCEDYGVRWLKERNEWNPDADWAVTTTELTAADHLEDMKGFARYVDSAISKTINLPYEYSFDDFKNIYIDAYESGYIKGVTTYRSGTMTAVLSAKEDVDTCDEEIILDDVELPVSAPSVMKTIKAEGKKWYLTVVYNASTTRPFALFVHTNNSEKNVITNNAVDLLFDLAHSKGIPDHHINSTLRKVNNDNNSSKITRAISMLLRHGVLIKNIVKTLNDVDDIYVGSFIFQIKKFLTSYIQDGETADGVECSDCKGHNVVFSEGCYKCNDCGSSKCG